MTKRTISNGDVFRVVANKGMLGGYNIQAKEMDKKNPRFYTIGRRNTEAEAIEEMNKRADIANIKGFC